MELEKDRNRGSDSERETNRGVNPPLFTVGISNCAANVMEYGTEGGLFSEEQRGDGIVY